MLVSVNTLNTDQIKQDSYVADPTDILKFILIRSKKVC